MASSNTSRVCFAAIGDVHGEHRAMVEMLEAWERSAHRRLAFVLQIGDFEANRGEDDRRGRSPEAHLGDFPGFIAGSDRFPWPVYVMGGNHEPYAWLDTLQPGHSLAPNCIWLGWQGVREIAGLRIAWLGGIHSSKAFGDRRPSAGLGAAWKLSTYFTAEDIAALAEEAERDPARGLDVLMLHEWPWGMVQRGSPNPFEGTAIKPWFVGNKPSRALVEALSPQLVVCGHMHVPFRASLRTTSGETIRTTQVCCLASVEQGRDACAFFEIERDAGGMPRVRDII